MFLCALKRVAKPLLLAALFVSTPSLSTVYVQVVDAVGYENLKRMQQMGLTQGGFLNSEHQTMRELKVNGTGNTGPSHATAFTGITPEQGGWVGNTYIAQGDSFENLTASFVDVDPQRHNNLIRELHKKGQSVACLNVPTINRNSQCELHLAFARRITESCGIDFSSSDAKVQLRRCFDGQDESVLFDKGALSFRGKAYEVPLETVTAICWEQDSKIQSRLLWREVIDSSEKLYVSPTHVLNANDEFKQFAENFLCWPGVVDPTGMRNARVSPNGFYHITMTQNQYAFELARHVINSKRYDVVLNYTSVIDTLQHEFVTPTKAKTTLHKKFKELLYQGYQALSDELTRTAAMLNSDDSMLVFSDHGTVYAHTVVFPNALLKSFGLKVEGPKAEVKAVTSGVLVHIYFSDDVTTKRRKAIAARLERASINGTSIFSQIYNDKSKPSSMLNHPNSGDIVALASLGFSLDPRVPPSNKYAYPTVATPEQLLEFGLSDKEKFFLMQGTPNRVSPGVHGFQSNQAKINGIVGAKGPIAENLSKLELPEIKDMKALVLSVFK